MSTLILNSFFFVILNYKILILIIGRPFSKARVSMRSCLKHFVDEFGKIHKNSDECDAITTTFHCFTLSNTFCHLDISHVMQRCNHLRSFAIFNHFNEITTKSGLSVSLMSKKTNTVVAIQFVHFVNFFCSKKYSFNLQKSMIYLEWSSVC